MSSTSKHCREDYLDGPEEHLLSGSGDDVRLSLFVVFGINF